MPFPDPNADQIPYRYNGLPRPTIYDGIQPPYRGPQNPNRNPPQRYYPSQPTIPTTERVVTPEGTRWVPGLPRGRIRASIATVEYSGITSWTIVCFHPCRVERHPPIVPTPITLNEWYLFHVQSSYNHIILFCIQLVSMDDRHTQKKSTLPSNSPILCQFYGDFYPYELHVLNIYPLVPLSRVRTGNLSCVDIRTSTRLSGRFSNYSEDILCPVPTLSIIYNIILLNWRFFRAMFHELYEKPLRFELAGIPETHRQNK